MTAPTNALLSTRFALSGAEWPTTAFAVLVSSAGYVLGGADYLARGVVGDLLGFVVLAAVGLRVRARVRHEALVCLLLIGLVLALSPDWPVRVAEPVWWALFVVGLAAYLGVRRRLCSSAVELAHPRSRTEAGTGERQPHGAQEEAR